LLICKQGVAGSEHILLCFLQGIQNNVQVNAAKRTPEQLTLALAAAQEQVEALKSQLLQLQGGSQAAASTFVCSGSVPGERQRIGPVAKWALVCGLQCAGLLAYFAAADALGCA
jgi:hypothetical protein